MHFHPTPEGRYSRAKYRKAEKCVEHYCFTLPVLTN